MSYGHISSLDCFGRKNHPSYERRNMIYTCTLECGSDDDNGEIAVVQLVCIHFMLLSLIRTALQ